MADDADSATGQLSTLTDPDGDVLDADADDRPGATTEDDSSQRYRPTGVRLAIVFGIVAIATAGALALWLGTQAFGAEKQSQQRALFLDVGKQGAINLTTIRAAEADADVRRILDSSTGVFHDDFQKRSAPFVAVVKQAQASSQGTITEAGIESATDDAANVLVAVAVNTTAPGSPPNQQPRLWRMRLTVQKVDGGAKISDVAFVQ